MLKALKCDNDWLRVFMVANNGCGCVLALITGPVFGGGIRLR